MEGRLKRYRRGYSLLQRYRAISIRDTRLAAQLTFDITNLIEFIADLEDEDQDEEDLMDIWDLEDMLMPLINFVAILLRRSQVSRHDSGQGIQERLRAFPGSMLEISSDSGLMQI